MVMKNIYLSKNAGQKLAVYLEHKGWNINIISGCSSLDTDIVSHPDIYMCKLGPDDEAPVFFGDPYTLSPEYPRDVKYNAACTGKYFIHNLKFTETINKIYGMKLKISPLNLSESILINKITYIKKIDNIYFDVKNDTNDAINDWFNYILFMADEQIFKTSEMLRWMDDRYLIENPYMSLDEVKNGSRGLKKTLELMRRK